MLATFDRGQEMPLIIHLLLFCWARLEATSVVAASASVLLFYLLSPGSPGVFKQACDTLIRLERLSVYGVRPSGA